MCPVFSSLIPFAGEARLRATFFSALVPGIFTDAGVFCALAPQHVTAFLSRNFLLA
jgi:hypothetical protein